MVIRILIDSTILHTAMPGEVEVSILFGHLAILFSMLFFRSLSNQYLVVVICYCTREATCQSLVLKMLMLELLVEKK